MVRWKAYSEINVQVHTTYTLHLAAKQVKSRPIIYSRKVMGHIKLADNPIYQEARRRGKKLTRDTYKPPEGGDKCESGVAR
eukprot:208111-Pleurochrysis_carterae.AAC.1